MQDHGHVNLRNSEHARDLLIASVLEESEGEDLQTVELSLDDLEKLLGTQSVQDAKTIEAIQWLLNRHRKATNAV